VEKKVEMPIPGNRRNTPQEQLLTRSRNHFETKLAPIRFFRKVFFAIQPSRCQSTQFSEIKFVTISEVLVLQQSVEA
jgi:hypothetical protein